MSTFTVTNLPINYQTLEDLGDLGQTSWGELSLVEEVQARIDENLSESPFYGVYDGRRLVAAMHLEFVPAAADHFFDPRCDHLELSRLAVLPGYRRRQLGSALVAHAQSLGLPVRTNALCGTHAFWMKLGFATCKANTSGEPFYAWMPDDEEYRWLKCE